MLHYFVRTTNERQLDDSYSQIEYELLVDIEHKPVKSFIEQLEIMNNYDSVLLEDDLILCKNFKERIEEVINKNPNIIINFFNAPTIYQDIKIDNNFSFQQCRYFPKGSCAIFINELKSFINKSKVCPCLNKIAQEHNLKIMQYRPCLVQHLDNSSLVNNKYGCRRTFYFIDYLDELGINYDEAVKVENQVKLRTLMNEKFERINK